MRERCGARASEGDLVSFGNRANCEGCGVSVPWAELANETLCHECSDEPENPGVYIFDPRRRWWVCRAVKRHGGWYDLDDDGGIIQRPITSEAAREFLEEREREIEKVRKIERMKARREYEKQEAGLKSADEWRKRKWAEECLLVQEELDQRLEKEENARKVSVGIVEVKEHRTYDRADDGMLAEVLAYPELFPEAFLRFTWARDGNGGTFPSDQSGFNAAVSVIREARERDMKGIIFKPNIDETAREA